MSLGGAPRVSFTIRHRIFLCAFLLMCISLFVGAMAQGTSADQLHLRFDRKPEFTHSYDDTRNELTLQFKQIESARFKREVVEQAELSPELIKRLSISSTPDGAGTEVTLAFAHPDMRVKILRAMRPEHQLIIDISEKKENERHHHQKFLAASASLYHG